MSAGGKAANMSYIRRIWTLTFKNLLITLIRPFSTTFLRALLLPVAYIAFISNARNLFVPPSNYGVGQASPLRSFTDALNLTTSGRNKVAFVNNGFIGGDIERVISQVSASSKAQGKQVETLSSENELRDVCRSSILGISDCIAAAVFYSSPSEGPGGGWNYSLRVDGALGAQIHVQSHDNDPEIYVLPFQHSIDWAIAQGNASINHTALPNEVMEYPFTSMTEQERLDLNRIQFMSKIIDIFSIAIFIGIVGVTYQLTGLVASEREQGITQLIDCMIPSPPWQVQAIRFTAAHLAFDLIYGPSWIIMALILKYSLFTKTSAGIVIVFQILSGLALSSFSLFGAAFFRKAQLSGISTVIACLLLGIIAQVAGINTNGAVIVLGLLFPPMNYVFFLVFMARWEAQDQASNLAQSAPENPWTVPGIVCWVLLIIQIIVYPILGALAERMIYGTSSKSRNIASLGGSLAININGLTKVYKPDWLSRLFRTSQQSVLAVDNLTLDVVKGEIAVLLGANGSGKSTTLDAISGLTKITSGQINIDFGEESGGFGLCPQKNVMWDSLTVKEHVKIFNRLKTCGPSDTDEQLLDLIQACDLKQKINSRTRTLSGGQKRKLQLAIMFTGGSSICCMDEVSSGLDPISRRKIWDILLAERGRKTILLTTHFLDEADLLADQIAILSKGALKAQGSSVELKNTLGSGYQIHVYDFAALEKVSSRFEGIQHQTRFDEIIYTVEDSARTAELVSSLEQEGITKYRVSGPTIEDVFLKVAVEASLDPDAEVYNDSRNASQYSMKASTDDYTTPQLLTGRRIGMGQQALILFKKRATICRRNYLPYLLAFLIPVVAAGLVSLFLRGYTQAGCSGDNLYTTFNSHSLSSLNDYQIVIGPPSKLDISALSTYVNSLLGPSSSSGAAYVNLTSSLHVVDSLREFNDYISSHFANVTPGGLYLGDPSSPPTFAWLGDGDSLTSSSVIQNAFDILLTNISISSQYQPFDIPFQPDVGQPLQLVTYFGLAMSVYPAFLALYTNSERLKNVRALHYSNGVSTRSLWLAYISFDFCVTVASSVLVTIIFRATSDVWYHLEYLFAVLLLYGLTSIVLSYCVSLFARSQLSTFAFSAGGQCVLFLLYFLAYILVLTFAPADKTSSYVNITHFTIALISPIGNLTRSMYVAFNFFSLDCRGQEFASYPGEITLYGGPILYLILQFFVLFGLLLWFESGSTLSRFRSKSKPDDIERKSHMDGAVPNDLERISSTNDGLRVTHLTKKFGKLVAVEDVTFGVRRGEVFALLGPNGAGKSTTISLIRGDIRPSNRGGNIFVEDVSMLKRRSTARTHLGVCPQFDAIDQMTVLEHLRFYASVRGVPDVDHNVREIIRTVGLTPYMNRMAAKLSGGNKRKLSLGIALIGNPSVLLLDEPSSGMDAASKRVMWRILASVIPGRSLLLTTHSMEEADALANRVGIMAKRMLALGSTEELRQKYGNQYHVHLVHMDAPHTPTISMEYLRDWVQRAFPNAVIERKMYHGQLRFSVAASSSPPSPAASSREQLEKEDTREEIYQPMPSTNTERSGISNLFSLLERNKRSLGIQSYSISQTSLDQLFLTIVGQHNVEEEGFSN